MDAQTPVPLSWDPKAPPGSPKQPKSHRPGNATGTRGVRATRGPRARGHHLCPERRGSPAPRDAAAPVDTPAGALPGTPGRLPRGGRPPSLRVPEPSASLGRGREAAESLPRAALGDAESRWAKRARPPSEPSPNRVTCAGSRGDSRAGGSEPGRERAAAGYRSLVIRPGPRADAGQSRPARCSAGARRASGSGPLEQQRRLLLPPPRPPGLRARVTAERLLKGAAALGLRLPLPAAPTPGQSGRGPEAGDGADLWVLELGSRKELRNRSTRGGLRGDSGRAPLAWNSVLFRVFPKQVTELASEATSESVLAAVSTWTRHVTKILFRL